MSRTIAKNGFFGAGVDTTRRTGVTPIASPYEEPEYADVGVERHLPGEVVQYPAPRPPLVTIPPTGMPIPPVPPPPINIINYSFGGGGGTGAQSDWLEMDSTVEAFIRNKPFVPMVVPNPKFDPTDPSLISIEINGTVYRLAAGAVGASDFLFGVSADATPSAEELTVISTDGLFAIPQYQGTRYWLIAREESEDDLTSVILSNGYYDADTAINQLGGFTKNSQTITVNSKNYKIWVSNNLLALTTSTITAA